MASRPVFVASASPELVDEYVVSFEWSAGLALSQKQKNIVALHQAASAIGLGSVLEVSSKSPERLGTQLSAFRLLVDLSGREVPVENAFQAAKVYEGGGPFPDLLDTRPIDARRDPRHRSLGPLKGFQLYGRKWPTSTGTLFYDFLYMHALAESDDVSAIRQYRAFSDIEFNRAKSLNCQARSCALFVSLDDRGMLEQALRDPDRLIDATRAYVAATLRANPSHGQADAFDL